MTSDTTPLSPLRKGIAGAQYLFVAFGATVLVPILVGLDPSTALFSAGIGTLLFHLVTKGKVPIFLGSSFAFIAPIIKATELYGLSGALFGCIGVSAVYFVMSLLIRLFGLRFISRLFPPVVIGPIIMLIGLSLSDSAVKMAATNWPLAVISLSTAIIVTLYGRGITKLIPIFLGIVVGYIADLPDKGEEHACDGCDAEDQRVGDLRQRHGARDLRVSRHRRSPDERGEETGDTVAEHRAVQAGVLDEVLPCYVIHHIHVTDMLDDGGDGHGDHEEDGGKGEVLRDRDLR